jgi:dTMP kinase
MALFISLEGGEGTGKSTQTKILKTRLVSQGYQVVDVAEPGGTELGLYLRDYLKATGKLLTYEAELYLFAAGRSELVRRILRPALESGKVVITDRYADSTTVYQGYGRRLPLRYVNNANELATDGLWPDLTILLDAPLEITLSRARVQTHLEVDPKDAFNRNHDENRLSEGHAQRFEKAAESFHQRIRDGYLKLAKQESNRWFVLNANDPVEVIAETIWQKVWRLLLVNQAASLSPNPRLPGM